MWMNQPSPHQEDLSREMVASGTKLSVIYASGLRKERRDIGWEIDADAPWTRFLSSRYSFLEAIAILLRQRASIHVVNGIWAEPTFFLVLALCCLLKIPCCIYSEAPASMCVSTWTSRLKQLVQRSLVRMLAKRVSGLLAISWLAVRAFIALGIPEAKIYRFGYFESMPHPKTPKNTAALRFRDIVYVGRLVRGKGVELLIQAATAFLRKDPALRLRIVGGGPMEAELRRLVAANRIESQVTFSGVVPSRSVPELLGSALMLVLPSESDGWGIVVNQALQAGTPVIVSDASGAAELVANRLNGYVFRTRDLAHLEHCIGAIVAQPGRMRVAAHSAGKAVSTEHAAPYLLQCFEHMLGLRLDRPVAGWILSEAPEPAQLPVGGGTREARFAQSLSC